MFLHVGTEPIIRSALSGWPYKPKSVEKHENDYYRKVFIFTDVSNKIEKKKKMCN